MFTLTELITLAASFAACISALSAVIAILQVKKQRESSYKPDLFLKNRGSIETKFFLTKPNSDFNYFQFIDDQKIPVHSILYTIENIGFGSAKNVKIDWSFNFKKAFKMLRNYCDVYEDMNGSSINFDHEGKNLIDYWFDHREIHSTTYDFVLPRSQERFNLSPSFPEEVTNVFIVFAFLSFGLLYDQKTKIIYREDFSSFPRLKGQISYQDILGKKYKKEVELDISISMPFLDNEVEVETLNEVDLDYFIEIQHY